MPEGWKSLIHNDKFGPALVALCAFMGALVTINPAGWGPGVTVDETFNVGQGYLLTESIRVYGVAFVDPAVQSEIYTQTLNDHPPLGRWWIGLAERAARLVMSSPTPDALYSLARARIGPAMAFALTIILIGCAASTWYGSAAGVIAALSLALMPRMFGHAHLASLESFIDLTYAAAVLSVAHYWNREKPPGRGVVCGAGALFGLALLSKVQAIFIPIPIALWALIRWRQRALLPLLFWGLCGLAVFYLGWPHLWNAPIDHLLEYLGRTTDRLTLYNWYLGEQYADRQTPWHYPSVLFFTTVPLGIQILAFIGVAGVLRAPRAYSREWLILGAILLPLLVFSLPGTPIYDGARLFLVVFPLWAIFAGWGGKLVYDWLKTKLSTAGSRWIMTAFIAAQAYGVLFLAPCWLSYYNLALGGLRGADYFGMERTYWSDSVTHPLLRTAAENIPDGSVLYVTPVLHQFQLLEMAQQEPLLREKHLELRPFENATLGEKEYLLIFFRRANSQISPAENWRTIAEVRREGVPLAGVYQFQSSDQSK